MVTRTRGGIRQGVWFSADVRFVQLTVDTSTYLADLVDPTDTDGDGFINESEFVAAVNSDLEIVTELLQQRCNVIGLSVETASIVQFIVDYGQAIDPLAGVTLGNQVAQDFAAVFEAEVIAETGATSATVVVEEGFVADPLGTPA